jgi:hypothetical protein
MLPAMSTGRMLVLLGVLAVLALAGAGISDSLFGTRYLPELVKSLRGGSF